MISGIDAFNNVFLAGLNATENRITKVNQQITSGSRVNEASDDPSAIASILDYQEQIHLITQVQTNLNSAATDASAADQGLQSASSILDQAVSIATQGASSTSDANTRAGLGAQVKALEQQLVAIANTSVNGRYIFGGDDPSTQPYTFDWSQPTGVVQSNTAGSTIL